MTEQILITYNITCNDSIEQISQDIAHEQTVELPASCIDDDFIKSQVVGQVNDIKPLANHVYEVKIAYHPDVTGYEIPQFLNLLYGNISIKNNIKLTDIELPSSLYSMFPGPFYGIDGIRKLTGIYARPLASTALKPMGTDPETLAKAAASFAMGGGDIIKDDHGLANQRYCHFEERVKQVQKAVNKVNEQTGRNTLYFPNILCATENINRQIEYAISHDIKGILVSPFLLGLDQVRMIRARYNLIIMGHPAFSGTYFHDQAHGMTPALLLGKIFRLIGCDISIYPNTGGRFSFSDQECQDLNHALQRPLNNIKPAFPSPAGGMSLERIPEMAKVYGKDMVYLIGGALLKERDGLRQGTEAFLDKIREQFQEQVRRPTELMISSCELPLSSSQETLNFIKYNNNFQWEGRNVQVYKDSASGDFKTITRIELTGNNGENTKFDLRYFQLEPGGFSSFERHLHEHVVICIRGKGTIINGDEKHILSPHDIAYVKPNQPHQLINEFDEPFGFFCIVDHERDKPVPG
jgi:ribulose-bisphosphate carboxylase large chain